ncbi:glycoside hydrolase family 28 protein [Sphingomonas sp. BIUV-7]|uniref:Glycoside hydrolase family 28 protein n=1 Tax=Sphingomonas natans TaxID=3063330 RepID=A0ABT8Y7V5_9SPHN|nr:glycoside hydrolase family 28 protein [Sphingomonas sp. BIUV-7]MDO6414087.1 glycoside hydrolase family 28 protein [Sphingomonas sp. BIUV-7]
MLTVDKRTMLLGSLASVASLGAVGKAAGAPQTPAGPMPAAPLPGLARGSGPFNLMCPPAARTSDSIAIVWDEPTDLEVEGYDVYLDGKLAGTTRHRDHTFQHLRPARTYEIAVRARDASGSVLQSATLRLATKAQPKANDIRTFGAVGDDRTLNTVAIQKAIDACPPGGLVRIPAGIFVSGALFLKSDMTLHLDAGAVLLGSTDPKDYPVMTYRSEGKEKLCYSSLIGTRDAKGGRWRDIAITGAGTINGNGSILRQNELAEKAAERGRVICIRDTDGLYLQGITVRQSPFWCVHPIYCNGVTVNGVSIHTKYDEAGTPYPHMVNGDGLDPDSCRDVFIFDCDISSQDDGIAIKSGRDAEGRAVGIPSENVRISHCRFHSGFGVAMGSEMAGGVRNVLVEDCVFENTFSIASVKAPRGRGNHIENVTYRDCTLKYESDEHRDGTWFRGALYVDQFYGTPVPDPHAAKPKDEGTALIRNILFKNITLETVGGNAIYLAGLPESPLQDIRFENVTARGAHGFVAYNVRGLTLDTVSVEARDGKGMNFVNVGS